MAKFPVDAPKSPVVRALGRLGFTQAGIARDDFLRAYEAS
jgi:hypothetical protein